MRVTNNMLSRSFLKDMNRNLSNLKTLQGQLTSGKEIQKPSDDPFKVARAMQIQSDINSNKQYGENISDTTNWLDTTDTALGQVGDILQRVRELMISAGDASYGNDEKLAVKDEINQKVGELAQVLNTNYDGSYVFAGTRGTAKPVMDFTGVTGNTAIDYAHRDGISSAPAVDIAMINSKLSVEISQGVTMEYNITAGDVLEFKDKSGAPKSLITLLSDITNHLDGNDGGTNAVVTTDLADITDAVTNLLRLRSEVGAKTNRTESAKTKNEDQNFNMTEMLANTEDVDITQKTMEYATMQTVYTASLQTSAKVLQPTLMDYLR